MKPLHTHNYLDHGHHFVKAAYGRLVPFKRSGRARVMNAVKDIPRWYGWDAATSLPYSPDLRNPPPIPEVSLGTPRLHFRR